MQPFPILKNDLTYDRINAETEIYGVIGDPIEQTLSPIVHNTAFRHLGLNKVMVPFLVPDGQLPEFFKELMWLDVKGCSVTIPHKEAIVPLLQQKENAVERTGTCNTVVLQAEGRRVGYNTDYRAAMDSLEQAMGGRVSEEDSSPLFEKHVMLLGAGGVARSIAFGLARRGPTSRSPIATTSERPGWPRRSAAARSPGRPARAPRRTWSSTAPRSGCIPTSTIRRCHRGPSTRPA